MEPKWSQKEWLSLPFLASKELLRFSIVFRPVLPPPGFPLASLLAPFGPFGLHFGSLRPPLGSLLVLFVILWLPLGFLGVFGPPKLFFASGSEILARSCQDLAEILLRTFQEFAKNQPRTRREVAFQIAGSTKRLRSPTKPFKIAQNKIWGGGVPPWGASIPIILARWRTLP